jgi:hypothetical protein
MWHGRIIRPRGQGAYGDGTNPVAVKIDESSIKHLPNVKIIKVGNVVGVVAPKEYDAIQAAAQLKVQWSDPPVLSGSGNLWSWMREQDSAGKAPARIATQTAGFSDAAMKSAAKTYSGTWTYHYQMHAPIGPNIAVADVTKDSAIVYTHIKNGYGNTRPQIAAALSTASNRTYDISRSAPSTTRAPARSAAVHSTSTSARRRLSCRSAQACPSGSSSCAGTSTAGTTTARRRCGTSPAASTRAGTSSRSTPRASAWAPTTRRPPSRRSVSR